MDEKQAQVAEAATDATFVALDRLFRLIYTAHASQFENADDIYKVFVVALAQTLGRHIAEFPEAERDEMAIEALRIQEEMTALCIAESAKAEISKAQSGKAGQTYDLSKMKPEGNA